jgi:hypothetical protein
MSEDAEEDPRNNLYLLVFSKKYEKRPQNVRNKQKSYRDKVAKLNHFPLKKKSFGTRGSSLKILIAFPGQRIPNRAVLRIREHWLNSDRSH